jgi:S-adenosylmethionine synthetase
VLDWCLNRNPFARVACEVAIKNDGRRHWVAVFGEITPLPAEDEIREVVRTVLRKIGYTDPDYGFDVRRAEIEVLLSEQAEEIRNAVGRAQEAREGVHDRHEPMGAGDQGMMIGYASDETPELMPLPIILAHRLARRLAVVRRSGLLPWLRPDGKCQVTVEYRDGVPIRVHTIVVSAQHTPGVSREEIKAKVCKLVIDPVVDEMERSLGRRLRHEGTTYTVNPAGSFTVGGPQADSGLTGRKIIVDTYGGVVPHGGGALSGKDATKPDRFGVYAARWVAKNVVGAGLARRCEVQLAYAIGVAEPVSIAVDAFGTGTVCDERIQRAIKRVFDLQPEAIINALKLQWPIYQQTATYGHFGRPDLDLPWERLDRVDEIRQALRRGC